MPRPLADATDLCKHFGELRALRDITLAIDAREFVTFLGPSGCGKTTTLRLIAGLLAPDAGEIRVGGATLSAPGRIVPPERRRMGMVFQNYAVWPHMSVLANIAFGLRLQRRPREEIRRRVDQVLAAVGLEGLETRSPAQLSGGQQQRVALARSLVLEPEILLLDEPLSNLDAKLRERMRGELKALQRRTGITFIYVTHDQAEAMALSDRIAVFRAGRVRQFATPREIYERPADLFVADFMGLVNCIPVSLQGVCGLDGNYVPVSIGPHRLRARCACVGTEEDRMALVIRPESIRFGPGGDGANTIDAIVRDATFLGNLIDYVMDASGVALRVQAEPRELHAPGTHVRLHIDPEDCVVMRNRTEREN